jgi:hypothetical protein
VRASPTARVAACLLFSTRRRRRRRWLAGAPPAALVQAAVKAHANVAAFYARL